MADQQTQRAAPHDPATERAVLGSMMLDADTRRTALETLHAADFYVTAHAHIFTTISQLHEHGQLPMPELVAAELRQHLNGTAPELRDLNLMFAEGSSTSGPVLVDVVRAYARRRQILTLTSEIRNHAREGDPVDEHVAALVDLSADTHTSRLQPADLTATLAGAPPTMVPAVWARDDGRAILYPGALTSLQTEPSQGKTWLALHACAQQIQAGHSALYIDVEASQEVMVERLRHFGLTDDQIATHFLYFRLTDPLVAADRLALVHWAQQSDATIAVFDTLAALLALHDLDENQTSEVLKFFVPVCRPLAHIGLAVLILDHVAKDKETRGRWARGASGKLGEVDAALTIRTLQAFSKTRAGHLRLVIAKDRHGSLGTDGDSIADIHLTPGDGHLQVRVSASPDAQGIAAETIPTHAMEEVSKLLESLGGVPLSKTRIEAGVPMKAATVRRALAELIRTAHLRVEPGPRNSMVHHLVTPYRAPADEPSGATDADLDF